MNIQIFGKNKCFDTKKAQRYFKERGVKFQYINLSEKAMSKGELTSVIRAVGGIGNLIDENGRDFCDIKYLLDDAKLEKLLDEPLYMKTPIVRNSPDATVGYCPDKWKLWK